MAAESVQFCEECGVQNAAVEKLEDVNRREILFLGLLAIAVLAMGVWPAPLLDVMHVSVDELLRQASVSKISALTAIAR